MKIRCLAPLFILLFYYSLFPTVVIGDEHRASTRSHYNIHAQLDYTAGSLTIFERVLFRNHSGEELSSVMFNVTPAHYGAFLPSDVTVEGITVAPILNGVNFEIPLPRSLAHGKEIEITFDFKLEIPRKGGRFGISDGVIALGNWFPIANPYVTGRITTASRPTGWANHRYIETGDAFFTEASDFEVTLVSSKPVVVAYSGTLLSQEENTWRFEATGVRDFALAISNRYKTQSLVTNGITVTAYYLPEDTAAGAEYLDAGARMLSWMNSAILPYPYKQLGIAEIHPFGSNVVGQEYPGLVFISSALSSQGGSSSSYLSYIVRHEVAHQWYYAIVGNDQVYSPWVDEAFATWMAYDYHREYNPSLFPILWQKSVAGTIPPRSKLSTERPVSSSIYDFPDDGQYFDVIYRRGAAFLEEAYQQMGKEDYYKAIRDYTATYRDDIATPNALLSILQRYSQTDLRPLIADYFGGEQTYRLGTFSPITVELPQANTWSGVVQPIVTTTIPITYSAAYVDDQLAVQSDSPNLPGINTAMFADGNHLLTIKLVDQNNLIIEFARRFSSYNPTTPTPVATITPIPLSAETGEEPPIRSLGKFAVFGLLVVAIAAGRSFLRDQNRGTYPESSD